MMSTAAAANIGGARDSAADTLLAERILRGIWILFVAIGGALVRPADAGTERPLPPLASGHLQAYRMAPGGAGALPSGHVQRVSTVCNTPPRVPVLAGSLLGLSFNSELGEPLELSHPAPPFGLVLTFQAAIFLSWFPPKSLATSFTSSFSDCSFHDRQFTTSRKLLSRKINSNCCGVIGGESLWFSLISRN